METEALGQAKEAGKLKFHWVAENLYRLGEDGKYYALLKRGNKQFRRSLKTKDRKLADRRLAELREKVGNLNTTAEGRQSFEQVAHRWRDTAQIGLKESSIIRRNTCIKNLVARFGPMPIRNIRASDCETWAQVRAKEISPRTFIYELDSLRTVFDYAIRHGLMLSNPAQDIRRPKLVQAPIIVPTREEFPKIIAAMRQADGRPHVQAKAKHGADLVEILAYSGCRLGEATALRWRDVDFVKGSLTINGGEKGTKNSEQRTIPITEALRTLLLRLYEEQKPDSAGHIAQVRDTKNGLRAACRRLGFHGFTHHDFRHLFATTCIESQVDIPTVSRWLGHRDGGVLAMKVYGHLRDDHSVNVVKMVKF